MNIKLNEDVAGILTVALLLKVCQLCLENALRFGHSLAQARLLLDLFFLLFFDSKPMLNTGQCREEKGGLFRLFWCLLRLVSLLCIPSC